MNTSRCRLVLAKLLPALFIASSSALSQTVFLDGGEFQVNSPTVGCVVSPPAVASAADGRVVVVWGEYGPAEWDVRARTFEPDGSVGAGPFVVNTYTTGVQTDPAVAMSADGSSFSVVYQSEHGGMNDLSGQKMAFDGTPDGAEVLIESMTSNAVVGESSIAMQEDGSFVVVWQSYGSSGTDTDQSSIQGRRFDANASPIGQQFQVNTFTPGFQTKGRVAIHPTAGDFAVVWNSNLQVLLQRYSSGGTKVGSEIVVDDNATGRSDIGMDAFGNYQVFWEDYEVSADAVIRGRNYSAGGLPDGSPFVVNTYTTGNQSRPRIAVENEGETAVTWEGLSPETDPNRSIQAGFRGPEHTELQVNSYTTGTQDLADVSIDDHGVVTVVWRSYGQTDSGCTSIHAQRFFKAVDLGGIPSIVGGTITGTGAYRSWKFFYLDTPGGPPGFQIRLTDLPSADPQDVDLYVRYALKPDVSNNDCVSFLTDDHDETCTFPDPLPGRYWVGVRNWDVGEIGFSVETVVPLIFADGFESSNTSAWSSTVP